MLVKSFPKISIILRNAKCSLLCVKSLAIRKNELSLHSQSRKGSLAQLVQSICLTSRGSAVRIRQLPQSNPKGLLFLFYAYGLYGERLGFPIFFLLSSGQIQAFPLSSTKNILACARPLANEIVRFD